MTTARSARPGAGVPARRSSSRACASWAAGSRPAGDAPAAAAGCPRGPRMELLSRDPAAAGRPLSPRRRRARMCGAARCGRPPRFSPRRGGAAAAPSTVGAARVAAAVPRAARSGHGGVAVHRMAQALHRRRRVRRMPVPRWRGLWGSGAAASVDLLGEATVTAAEADRYARRCDEALRTLPRAERDVAGAPAAGARRRGRAARVNLSVKVTALTPRVRAEAPELGSRTPGPLRGLLRTAQGSRRAPARRHGVDGLAGTRHRARPAAAGRA